MKNYYKNELVKVLRTYQWRGKSKAEIQFSDGHNEIVNMSEVYLGDITGDLSDTISLKPDDKKVEIEIDNNAFGSINKPLKYIVSNVKKKTDSTLTESELKKFITKHKLDPEAIDLCLHGKQKTHKGYSFAVIDN